MPSLTQRAVLELAKGVKAYLDLNLGLTRTRVPDSQAQNNSKVRKLERRLSSRKKRIGKLEADNRRLRERLLNYKKRDAVQVRERLEDLYVEHKGVILPPRNLRPCGAKLRNDEFYLESAKRNADRLIKNVGLNRSTSLLDVGSGPGRLAIGILQQLGDVSKYRGADVSEDSIRWADRHITPSHPNFRFVHLDANNARYNPSGGKIEEGFEFPFGEKEFDLICLYSVFSHMLADDVRAYLKDFHRILRPDGRILMTAFVEDGVPDITENPEGYKGQDWSGPLHCVRYSRSFFEQMLLETGFRLRRIDSAGSKLQTRLHVSKAGV